MKGFSARCWKEVRKSVKSAAIESVGNQYGITYLCEYFGVSRSGYYAWKKRQERPDRDGILGKLVRECQESTNYTYGYRRVRLWLLYEAGLVISHKAVLRLMRKYSFLAQIRRPRQFQIYENKLERNFRADRPNQKWVTDISYIHTKQGVLYLSIIKDRQLHRGL